MPSIARPQKVYDFTAHARRQPTAPPPGDRIDAQLANHADAIAATQLALERLIESRTKAPDVETPVKALLAQAEREVEAIHRAAHAAAATADQAWAQLERVRAEADRARDAADRAEARLAAAVLEAQAKLTPPTPAPRDPTPPNSPLEGPPLLGYAAGGPYAADVAGATATSADYAQVSIAWAEYMDRNATIPPNILAINAISGEHWSSRWWAHRAGELTGGFINGLYLGPFPTPPLALDTGAPIPIGSLYFDTANNQMYVWNGTAWAPFTTPQKAATGTVFYAAAVGQTTFPLTVDDLFGNALAALDPSGDEGIEVALNGVRLTPSSGGFVGDFSVDYPSSSITLAQPAFAGAILSVDVLLSPLKLAPVLVLVEKLQPIAPDGTTTTFTLRDSGGALVAISDAVQLNVTLEGVAQEPGVDFIANGSTLTFAQAPTADARSFLTLFTSSGVPGGGPGGGLAAVETDATLQGVGIATDPLSVSIASPVDIEGGFFNDRFVTPLGFRVAGDNRYLQLTGGGLSGPLAFALGGVPNWTWSLVGNDMALTRYTATGVYIDQPFTVQNTNPLAGSATFQMRGVVMLDRSPTQNNQAANKLYVDQSVTGAQQYIGQMNAANSAVQYTAQSGHLNGYLIPANLAGANHYVIIVIGGVVPSDPNNPPEINGMVLAVGDWLISDGFTWNWLGLGTFGVTAANVALTPAAFQQTNVQAALAAAETQVAANTTLANAKIAKSGDTMTGDLRIAKADDYPGPTEFTPVLEFTDASGGAMAWMRSRLNGYNGSPEAEFEFWTNNGGYGSQKVFSTNIGGPPTTTFYGPLDLSNRNIANVADPGSPQDAATKAYADNKFLAKTGDVLLGGINVNGHWLTELPDPTAPQDAATKNYVDNHTQTILTGKVAEFYCNETTIVKDTPVTWATVTLTGYPPNGPTRSFQFCCHGITWAGYGPGPRTIAVNVPGGLRNGRAMLLAENPFAAAGLDGGYEFVLAGSAAPDANGQIILTVTVQRLDQGADYLEFAGIGGGIGVQSSMAIYDVTRGG